MVKKYEIKGMDGNWIQFSETEELDGILITITEPDFERKRMSMLNVLVDKDNWTNIQSLGYKLQCNQRKEKSEDQN